MPGSLRQYLFFRFLQKHQFCHCACRGYYQGPEPTLSHRKSRAPNGLSLFVDIYRFVNKYPLDTLLSHADSSIVAPVQRHIASRRYGLGVGTSPI